MAASGTSKWQRQTILEPSKNHWKKLQRFFKLCFYQKLSKKFGQLAAFKNL
jgi:hypothetical protein